MDHRIRYLLDREAIDVTLATYCRGIDRHDVDIIEAAYFADAQDNHGPFRGPVSNGFAEWGNALHSAKSTTHMHNITTRWVEVKGDRATADTYVLFALLLNDRPKLSMGSGRYIDRLERRDGEWRIASRETTIDIRMLGDATGWAGAGGGYPVGHWDRTDVSYAYPFDLPDGLQAKLDARGPRPAREERPVRHPLEAAPLEGEALLARLLDRRAIADSIAASVRGLDRQDRTLALSAFANDAIVHRGDERLPIAADIDRAIAEAAQDLAQARHITTHNAVIDGDRAVAETYLLDCRRRVGDRDVWTGGLRLVDRLTRDGARWVVAERVVIGDWEFLSHDASFDPADTYLRSRRGSDDPLSLDPRDQRGAINA